MSKDLVKIIRNEPRADSRLIAERLGIIFNKHHIEPPEGFGFTPLEALSLAGRLSFTNQKAALELIHLCDSIRLPDDEAEIFEGLRHPIFCFTIECQSAIWQSEKRQKTELEVKGIHKRFVARLSELIPGAEIVKFKRKKGHTPDFMIEVDGKQRPVELKKKCTVQRNIEQIIRYITMYKADIGYIVAPVLKAELPDNVIFVQCD